MSADIWLADDECCSAHDHNVTHNLGPMFREAGVDWHEYRDERRTTKRLGIECLNAQIEMLANPEKYRAMNPENGWGDYDGALDFLARLARDCLRHPDAIVQVSL